jgi:hypothetical protein
MMKFQLLPLGSRFEFEAKLYVKTGPLTATAEEGGQRMIPRSAVLKVLAAPVVEKPKAGRKLSEATVMTAFEVFFSHCARLLQATESDVLRASALRAELDAAREKFLAELK